MTPSSEVFTTTLPVANLCCADEEAGIHATLRRVKGVRAISVNLVMRTVTVTHSCPAESVARALARAGFHPSTSRSQAPESQSWWTRYHRHALTLASGFFISGGMLAGIAGAGVAWQTWLFALSILAGGWHPALRGFTAVRAKVFDMNLLMVAASIAAATLGKWGEGAAVVFLFSLSQLMEVYSLDRSRKAIRSLLRLSPPTANIRMDGTLQAVDAACVAPGQSIIILPGERIPLDGTVLAGESLLNQAPITGESEPVCKGVGDRVFAGSLNGRGSLEVQVTRHRGDTTLERIVRMVEEAQSARAPIQTTTDTFARVYTPAVLALAAFLATLPPLLGAGTFVEWLYRALVLVVIACPCALVISTPVTILSGLTRAARSGILIKGGRYLEEFGRVEALAFDKTGTLTHGAPRVTDVVPMAGETTRDIIRIAAALEATSEHHLAAAILEKALSENIPAEVRVHEDFEALTGRGVRATVSGTTYVLGSHILMEELGVCSPAVEAKAQLLEGEGKTVMILSTDRTVLGLIAVADDLREDAPAAVRDLRGMGVRHIVMLTGDNSTVAQTIARRAGIGEWYAGVLPEEKADRIRHLKKTYGSVAMVGDGINDAPSLAAATVGVSMGVTGTDIALETADIVLMADDLSRLPALRILSRRTLAIIRQNIALALGVKLLFLALGAAGIATLPLALLADDGAAFAVILNGMRALRGLPRNGTAPE